MANGNLMPSPTPFIGRSREIARVAKLLGTNRVVTLTGPAGMGKTRLATEVAFRLADDYDDGVWVVELASLHDPAGVPRFAATALGLAQASTAESPEGVASQLRRSKLLLVLDNCEHLVGACAALVREIILTCPGVSVLATSQQALGLEGERAFALGPLLLPADLSSQEKIASSDAYELFVTRARAAREARHDERAPSGPMDPADVIEICRRLDGLPLAIELAAARAGLMSPAEMIARLDDRFEILEADPDIAGLSLPRHRSLQLALEWSFELLDKPQQALLRRLAVFAGGATLEAIQNVVPAADLPAEDVANLLDDLAAKSLLAVDSGAQQPRYRLLETIRLFGQERLEEAGELGTLRAGHGTWFLVLAERAEPELTRADQQAWVQALEEDHNNLRAALEWALTSGENEVALRLGGALTLFWRVRGHFREGRDWLARVLATSAALGPVPPPSVRAKALWGTGYLHLMSGDHHGATLLLHEAVAYQRSLGETAGWARSLLILGECELAMSGPPDALLLFDESAVLARSAGDTWCLTHALSMAGSVRLRLGELNQSRAAHHERRWQWPARRATCRRWPSRPTD